MVEAVGFDATLSRVIRDRDGIYGKVFDARVRRLGLEQFRIAPRSPGRTGTRSASWARYDASFWTT